MLQLEFPWALALVPLPLLVYWLAPEFRDHGEAVRVPFFVRLVNLTGKDPQSGAVVQRLGITGLLIGPQIDPGIPWTVSIHEPQIALALKSGNFGARDFFTKAWKTLG